MADAEGFDGRTRIDVRAQAERESQSGGGCAVVGDTEPARLEGHRADAGQSKLSESRYASPRRWPVGPGQEQHEWEAPRLTQRDVGHTVDGISGRLARTWNRHALKALGNAQVPQVVEVIARAILQTEMTERSGT
jgi:hypothetical protein